MCVHTEESQSSTSVIIIIIINTSVISIDLSYYQPHALRLNNKASPQFLKKHFQTSDTACFCKSSDRLQRLYFLLHLRGVRIYWNCDS